MPSQMTSTARMSAMRSIVTALTGQPGAALLVSRPV